MKARWMRGFVGAALVGACAMMSGCQAWNAWLDFLKWKPKEGGAPLAQEPAAPKANPLTAGTVANSLVPRVAVYRITVPVGAFSGNTKIWSQLNEDAIDSKTAVLMAQNGLRAATGSVGRWPAVAQLLDVPANYQPQTVQTDGRTSINVLTRQNVTDQIVVSVDRDLQQQGRTFERCDNGFRLSIRGVRNKPELQVQLEPVVTLGTVQIVRPGMGFTNTGFTSEETFEDLRMAATLNAQQFLVISAMDPKASPFSVGTLWLSDHDKVPATETVLVFVPAGASAAK
jgi:hypothetical protein